MTPDKMPDDFFRYMCVSNPINVHGDGLVVSFMGEAEAEPEDPKGGVAQGVVHSRFRDRADHPFGGREDLVQSAAELVGIEPAHGL